MTKFQNCDQGRPMQTAETMDERTEKETSVEEKKGKIIKIII